jgi:8-oxo-dGTP diphosphatase
MSPARPAPEADPPRPAPEADPPRPAPEAGPARPAPEADPARPAPEADPARPAPEAANAIAVAVDLVVLTLDEAQPRFLAVQREREPFAGACALPGARVRRDEDLDAAARRVLEEAAGRVRHREQLATFGAAERDPRGRVVSVCYLALLPRPARAGQTWLPALAPPPLAFDHEEILATAVDRLRAKLTYSNVAYGLLPDEFTLSELQAVYEAVLNHPLDKRNFRKKVLGVGLVTEAEGQRRGSHRPAQLYRFPRRELVLLDDVITT